MLQAAKQWSSTTASLGENGGEGDLEKESLKKVHCEGYDSTMKCQV